MLTTFKIVILISGNGSNLQAIIDVLQQQNQNAEICAVISNRADAFGLIRAKNANIPAFIIEPIIAESKENYDLRLVEAIKPFNPDLIVLAGFMRILTPIFVNNFYGKIINIHPSLLPKYPGLNTHQQVLNNQDRKHGCTIHFVTEDLDAGPIIAQAECLVEQNDTVASLKEKVQRLEHQLYPHVIQEFIIRNLKRLT